MNIRNYPTVTQYLHVVTVLMLQVNHTFLEGPRFHGIVEVVRPDII